jgi:hypothetical protein
MSGLKDDIKQLKTGTRDLRKFGLLVGGVFALLAAWCWFRGKPAFPYFLGAAVPLIALGAVAPRTLKWVYVAWMSLALMLGLIVSTVLLTVFYYVVVTPIGLFARAIGQDFLSQRLNPAAASYWIPRTQTQPKQRQEYERQF